MIGTTDISYKMLRDILNAHGGNVGNRHTDYFSEKANINKWSKRKPVTHPAMFKLTDEDFASVNWGWEVVSYSSPFKLIDAWLGDFWSYTLPTDNLRISDFINYDPDAVNPFNMELLGPDKYKAGEVVRLTLPNEDIQHIVKTYKVFEDVAYDLLNIGVMYYSAFKEGMKNVYYSHISTLLDFDSEKLSFTIPADIANGDYKVIVVFTNYNGSKFDVLSDKQEYYCTWFGIPCEAVSFSKVEYITPSIWEKYSIVFNSVTMATMQDPQGYLLDSFEAIFSQTLANDYPYTVYVSIAFCVQSVNGEQTFGTIERYLSPSESVIDDFVYSDSPDRHIVMVEIPEKIGVTITATVNGEQRVWETSAPIDTFS